MTSIEINSSDIKPRKLTKLLPEDEIVISGVAGRFPECDNLYELHKNLLDKVDLITDDDRRWKSDHPEIPQRSGKINNIEKFDATFFGVHFKQAHTMDPMCRLLLEHAYEAVIDAGVNPKQLYGTKTGVFIGACFSESEKTWFYDKVHVNGFGITGCARSMLANRISYFLGTTGPSYTIDTACSSSLVAMDNAYRAIREGLCDAAIVGGANLCLHPYVSMQFFKLGVLSIDGYCRTFDENAGGYVRSEAVSAIFLQKTKDAKRIYGTVVHSKINSDGFKKQGVTFPSSRMQSVLLKEFYLECGISPTMVDYIETHGTATRVGDPEEVNAIDNVFSAGRSKPLLIGSVKSNLGHSEPVSGLVSISKHILVPSVKLNLGHSEPVSGLVSISKVILAMENGVIQPNIHYKSPRQDIKSLIEGRIKVNDEATPWEGGYIGVNSFGFGGVNAHVLIKSNPKSKIDNGAPNDDLPRLVVVSGRNENAVSTLLNDLESKPVDVDYVRLLHDIHSEEISGHLCRGYTILPAHGVIDRPIREIEIIPVKKRPVWFVFSGMGSQWPGMGKDLLRLPVFAEAIHKCDAALKSHDINIYHIITNKDETAFDNILNSFVGIAAVQIGLVDVLLSLGIVPDHLIGHSVGELGCAYADGCFTAEQMIMSAYARGLASIESNIIHGSMAAVGLGYKELKHLCPSDIEVACHNSVESATISGPTESIKIFVPKLQAEKIFAKEVACSNIPYHSRYIAPAGSKLLKYLQKIIPHPKSRSKKWVSTSVPMNEWDTEAAQYSSAEYHTNNLLNAVLFEETSSLIPEDAITIEIAPHGLLQAILRRSLNSNVMNLALTQRNHKNNIQHFLQIIGKLFNAGLHFKLANIYPYVQYPVSRSTPMISPLIKWEHLDDWFVTSFKVQQKVTSGERIVQISLTDSNYEYMSGHVIDGRNLFPATGYLVMIWETLGMMNDRLYVEVPVIFENIKFIRATTIPKDKVMEFTLMIHKGSGNFEIVEGNSAVVSGNICVCENLDLEKVDLEMYTDNEEEILASDDIYKELRLRGYQYSGLFRGIESATHNGLKGHISWHNNWITFMDNMLQMKILGKDTRDLLVPTSIKKIIIDSNNHLKQLKFNEQEKDFPVYVNNILDLITCGGVQIHGLEASSILRKKLIDNVVLEEYKFVPYMDETNVNLCEIARLTTHISIENNLGIKVKTIEFVEETDELSSKDLLTPWFSETLRDIPLIQAEVCLYSTKKFEDNSLPSNISIMDSKKITTDSNGLLVSGCNLLSKNSKNLKLLFRILKIGGFLITRENANTLENIEEAVKMQGLDIVLKKKCEEELFILLKKHQQVLHIKIVNISNQNFDWIKEMRQRMAEEIEKKLVGTRILLVGQNDFENGLMGLFNCLRQEPGGEIIRGLLIHDSKAPQFSLRNPFYAKQLEKDLAINVLSENYTWGSYRHVLLPTLDYKLVKHAWVDQLIRGDLSSLRWVEGSTQFDSKNEHLIHVVYSSINFRDIMLASGKLALESVAKTRQAQKCFIGFEYCGINNKGKKIMGMIENQAMTNLCIADPDLSWEVPNNWTLEDAATVPCVYATCYYALYICGKMKKGDKVLIHAGSGGVGQAAINLAIHEGCEIFTTVGTPEKQKFIREHFPLIKEDHIGNSRDTSFEKMIRIQTKGKGVDIVLNSLAEEKLQASVACLGWGGRFLEIGKFDLFANNLLGMKAFLKEISFHGVMLDALFTTSNKNKTILKNIVTEGLKNGAIKPLVRTVFSKHEVEAAFRYMAAGKHIGKVILKIREEDELFNNTISALPRYHCLPDRSYIILGGLGGFGLELADWLVLRGAKNLVFVSRNGVKNGYQKMRIKVWESYGVYVKVIAGKDASKQEECEWIIKTACEMAPVDGIFNLAVVLKDALWENQTVEFFKESFRPKAWATKHLDLLSRKLCPYLRQFVVFSSVSCGKGNAGQANYGMSNSVMERICEKRSLEGFPGLAIQWGAIGDVGLVADMQKDNKELLVGGTVPQRISSCLQELDGFLQQKKPVVSSMVVAEKKAGEVNLSVFDTVLDIMGLKNLKGVSPYATLTEIGMDSIMSVEIKQTLEREFEIFLSATDMHNLNFAKLQEMSTNHENPQDFDGVLNEESTENIKSLIHVIRPNNLNSEIYMRLQTKEESNRSEVFLIPGFEGLGSVFLKLAANIKAPATCLQLGLTTKCYKSIFEVANYFLPHVLKKCKCDGKFVIAAHSFGVLIALELARILETEGLKGRLVLIDGAPNQLKAMTIQYLPSFNNDEELENSSISGIINSICPENTSQLNADLQKCKTWENKLEAFIKHCPDSKLELTVENKRALCTALHNRFSMMLKHDISQLRPLKTPIILLKPTLSSIYYEDKTYDLSKITSEKVEVYYAKGTHLTMLDDEIVVRAINGDSLVDEQIFEDHRTEK